MPKNINCVEELNPQRPPNPFLSKNRGGWQWRDRPAPPPRPEQVIGLHFFSPVEKMPLVEV
ncbi:3-hydroxyacyl-CoA dehydrogenase NAD-binding domain-containing protein, partial [Enterobacter mori]